MNIAIVNNDENILFISKMYWYLIHKSDFISKNKYHKYLFNNQCIVIKTQNSMQLHICKK